MVIKSIAMKRITILCMLLLCSLVATSQELRFVKGVVLGKNGQRLSGVTVKAKNADVEVCSKHDGTFEMRVPLFATKLEASSGKEKVSAKIDGGYIVLKLDEYANKNGIVKSKLKQNTDAEVENVQVSEMVETGFEPVGVAVYASCKSGMMMYRGVNTQTGEELFTYGPIAGTEEVGEFLAVVHALTFLKTAKSRLPVFSDNEEILSWVKKNKCKAQMLEEVTEHLQKVVSRSELWLRENSCKNLLVKWNAEEWGKNPAFIEE